MLWVYAAVEQRKSMFTAFELPRITLLSLLSLAWHTPMLSHTCGQRSTTTLWLRVVGSLPVSWLDCQPRATSSLGKRHFLLHNHGYGQLLWPSKQVDEALFVCDWLTTGQTKLRNFWYKERRNRNLNLDASVVKPFYECLFYAQIFNYGTSLQQVRQLTLSDVCFFFNLWLSFSPWVRTYKISLPDNLKFSRS